jgi:inosine-uridine nucleoside N-ribohydrolase
MKNITHARSPRIPVILDTDIGTDIDDTWALAQLLRSPELDARLILTGAGNIEFRTAVTARFLHVTERTDVPIGRGIQTWDTAPSHRNQEPWIKGFDLAAYTGEVAEDGIGRMIEIIESSPVPVTIIAIGPAVNLAAALARAPGIASRCRLVGMFGSFDIGYEGATLPSPETNVRLVPDAFRQVMAAPWIDVLLTPLDTCGIAILDGENYHRVWSATADPMMRALIENYCIFAPRVTWMHCHYFAVRSTVLFDCVAIYLAYSEDLVEIETVRFTITDDGFTRRDPDGSCVARVALRWRNLAAFHDHLTTRLLGEA